MNENYYDNILVTVSASNMRRWGRQALEGHWNKAILGTLIYYLVSLVPTLVISTMFEETAVQISTNLYAFLVSGPLLLGYTIFLIAIFRRQPSNPSEVFYGFEKFGKSFGLYFMMNLFIMLWMLLFIVPGIIASLRYAMAFYIMADKPEIGVMDAIAESKRMMNGNKWKYFCLQISFIGWFCLMGGLLIPVAMIPNETVSLVAIVIVCSAFIMYLVPYITASSVGFYEVANGNLRPAVPADPTTVEASAETGEGEKAEALEAPANEIPEREGTEENKGNPEDEGPKVEVNIRER